MTFDIVKRLKAEKAVVAGTINLLDEVMSEIERLRLIQEKAEQVSIAYGMGWDLPGVMDALNEVLLKTK